MIQVLLQCLIAALKKANFSLKQAKEYIELIKSITFFMPHVQLLQKL